MPKFDGTGPTGMGPGTGRGMGPCFGFGPHPMYRRNRGLGRYFGWGYPEGKNDRKKALSEYKKALEEELEDIKKAEAELNKES